MFWFGQLKGHRKSLDEGVCGSQQAPILRSKLKLAHGQTELAIDQKHMALVG
jgi:hypothetical protein